MCGNVNICPVSACLLTQIVSFPATTQKKVDGFDVDSMTQ